MSEMNEVFLAEAKLRNWSLKAKKASRGLRYCSEDDLENGKNLCDELIKIDPEDGVLSGMPGINKENYEKMDGDVYTEEILYTSEVIEKLDGNGCLPEEDIVEGYKILERIGEVFDGAADVLNSEIQDFYRGALIPKRKF
jgi:hypothetical protein